MTTPNGPETETIRSAEAVLPVTDLKTELPFFLNALGFRLDTIFPADDPAVAVISGHGTRIRLERGSSVANGQLRLYVTNPEGDRRFAISRQNLHFAACSASNFALFLLE